PCPSRTPEFTRLSDPGTESVASPIRPAEEAAMRPAMRCASLHGYVGLAESVGLDPARLLARAGLQVADVAVPDRWVPATAIARVLELSATESGREDFGL